MKKLTPTQIQAARIALSVSQPIMAQLLGVHEVTISKWENGRLRPSPWQEGLLRAFADAGRLHPDIGKDISVRVIRDGVPSALHHVLAAAFGDL